MLLLQFFHDEDLLIVGDKEYKATCPVRNELNGERKDNQIVKTFPVCSNLPRKPYYPRKFPTGVWRIKPPEWTDDPEYAPVKIPTDAIRRILTRGAAGGKYAGLDGGHQDDAFYHLHFAKLSRSTLGCIRLSSDADAREIACRIEGAQKAGQETWIEVIASRRCY